MMALVDTPHYGNRILYLSLVASFIFLLFIVQLVRQRRLTERFALAWMIIPLLLIFFSSNRGLLEWMASIAGIYYAPALMIPILFGLFVLVSLYFSVKATRAEQQIKKLTQEMGLMKKELDTLKAPRRAPRTRARKR